VITRDDAALVASDPALPGLGTVLDDERFAAALQGRLTAVQVDYAQATSARYLPGKHCVVTYRLMVSGAELEVYAQAHTRESFARHAANLSKRKVDATGLGAGIALRESSVLVLPFTGDPGIPVLADLGNVDRRHDLLAELLPEDPSLWAARIEPLRYWPERRFTCCLTVDGKPRAALKAYAAARFEEAAQAAAAFRDCVAPRISRLIARSDQHRILVFEWIAGDRLERAVADSSLDPEILERVGSALAALHNHPATRLRSRSPSDRAAVVRVRADRIATMCTDLARPARALATRLAAELAQAAPEQRAIHGDFSSANVLMTAEVPAIIDLDSAGRGDPVTDLGSFAALLERQALHEGIPRARVDGFLGAVLSGYRGTRSTRIDPSRLRVWTAAELVTRAPAVFRRCREGWRRQLAALIARAEEVLTGA
jgi:aminoglycoside phosphotransferase (APT) family kinase protein